MRVSINQPAYLPWLGYFDRINMSDVHVVLDHVQFEKNSMINRNKVRTQQGSCWLTIPVKTKGNFGDLAIDQLTIDRSSAWQKKHFMTLCQSYSKARYFSRYIDFFESVYMNSDWVSIHALIKKINQYFLHELNIDTKIVYSSDFDIKEHKNELLLKICEKLMATRYLSGPFGRDYLDTVLFSNHGIKVEYHDYHHPTYSQVYEGFEANMSVVDLLFNHGPNSLEILSSNGICKHVD